MPKIDGRTLATRQDLKEIADEVFGGDPTVLPAYVGEGVRYRIDLYEVEDKVRDKPRWTFYFRLGMGDDPHLNEYDSLPFIPRYNVRIRAENLRLMVLTEDDQWLSFYPYFGTCYIEGVANVYHYQLTGPVDEEGNPLPDPWANL